MLVVTSKVIGLTSSKKEDRMFVPPQDFYFEDLICWVYRNCPCNRRIVVEDTSVSAHYDDRVEIYYLREGK